MKLMRTPRRQGSIIGGETGAEIVEMALMLPLFVLLTIGLAEFGNAWFRLNTMSHAAREAVRLAAVTPGLTADDAAVIAKATTILANGGVIGAIVNNTAPVVPAPGAPSEVTVNIVYTLTYLTGIGPIFGFSFIGNIPLPVQAVMHYEL